VIGRRHAGYAARRMDDVTTRLLTEIRDLLQRQLELASLERTRAAKVDAERAAMNEETMRMQRTCARIQKRGTVVAAIVVGSLLVYLVVLSVQMYTRE
jgi:hypothetical protein